MKLDDLRDEVIDLVARSDDEAFLRDIAEVLRKPNAKPVTNADGEELVSFDPDGTGYTASQLGDMLDDSVAKIRSGEMRMLSLEEFNESMRSWRRTT